MAPGGGVALVTGAANGIGRAIAERLRADGFAVAGVDIEPHGEPGVTPYIMDVGALDTHAALLDRVERELGPVAVLVNVAGIQIPQALAELTVDAYRRQHAVLLDGPIWLARAAGLRMAARGSGRIVNVSSIHASRGDVGSIAYDSAKAGLEAATRALAIELGPHGVLVNAVAPGYVRTRLSMIDGESELDSAAFREVYLEHGRLPLRRGAEPPEIAATVSHLVAADNTYLTGQRVVVDGGLTITF